MAIREVGPIAKRWTGLSSDVKPFDGQLVLRSGPVAGETSSYTRTGADVPGGSEFLETDTGRLFRYNGADWQYVADPLTTIADRLGDLLQEVVTVRHLLLESLASK